MGGQACVFYGGAEFSRDVDITISSTTANFERLRLALQELQAECIAVPPFERKFLDMGLAVHFRCQHAEARNVRIDVLSRMRSVEGFEALWRSRTTIEVESEVIELIPLAALVRAKKTQRDKDWPMLARLVEANYFQNRARPSKAHAEFWLRELRTPSLLVEVASRFSIECVRAMATRVLLEHARTGDLAALREGLREEERKEREADIEYWRPLKKELEKLRRAARLHPEPG